MTPNWLDQLEKKIGWFSLPNLAFYLIALQIFGLLLSYINPAAMSRLILIPQLVLSGEYWRLLTFMAIPLGSSFLFIIFLYFLYFIISTLESHWGEFKTTFYLFIAIFMTIAFSFAFNYPVSSFVLIETTLFLAVATLFPEFEILLFFILPVKMKWMALISAAFVIMQFLGEDLIGKLYIAAVFLNYFVFFGASFIGNIRNNIRRNKFKRTMRDD